MNTPPETFVRVQSALLEAFVKDCFLAVGMADGHAQQMAGWLTANDLRGVFSHGTRQTVAYVGHFQKQGSQRCAQCAGGARDRGDGYRRRRWRVRLLSLVCGGESRGAKGERSRAWLT